jgi:hypothetical protein
LAIEWRYQFFNFLKMQNVKKAKKCKNEVFEFKINDIWIKKVGTMGCSIFVSISRLNAIKTQNKHF